MTGSPNPAPPPRAWRPVAAAILTCCLAAYATAVTLLHRSGGAGPWSAAGSAVAAIAGVALLVMLWLGKRAEAALAAQLAEARRKAQRQAELAAAQEERSAGQDRQLEQAQARERELKDDQAALRGRLDRALAAQQALAAQARAARQAVEHMVTVRLPAAFEGTAVEPAELPDGLDAELVKLFDQLEAESVRAGDREESMRSAVVALSRRVQTAAHRIQEEATLMADRHPGDPDVLEVSMRVDHVAAQQARHAQSMAVLCGEWPGQQWPDALPLVDVVRAAAGRIIAFQRVEVIGDPDVAASASAVEPLVHLVAELLANATQSSPPSTAVPVTVRDAQRGAVIEVNDCGLGLDDHRLTRAQEIASGARLIGLDMLGEYPQTGLAVVGQYARRHGFRVDVSDSVYGGVRAVIGIPAELVETVAPAEAATVPSATLPAARADTGRPGPADGALGSGPELPRRHSPRHGAAATVVPLGQPSGAGDGPGPAAGGERPTPEQAGAWMSAFLTGDAEAGLGHDGTGHAAGEPDNSAEREI